MSPTDVSKKLITIANYIASCPNPDKIKVISGLKSIVHSVAADVKEFTQKDFDQTFSSFDNLISRLERVKDSVNKQNPDRRPLDNALNEIMAQKDALLKTFKSLNVHV